MEPIARCIGAARLWLLAQGTLTWLGRVLLVILAVAAGFLLADRLLGLPAWPGGAGWPGVAMVAGGLTAAAVLTAMALAWWQLPGRAETAAMIDHRLGLKDTISTALYASELPEQDGFAQQVIEQGRQQARHLKIRQAFALRPGRSWAAVVPGVLAVAAMALFLPAWHPTDPSEQPAPSPWTQADAQQQFEQAIARVEDWAGRHELDEGQDPLTVLEQLADRDLADPAQQAEALEELSRVQDQLADQAAQQRQQARELATMLSRIEPSTAGPADDLADALRRSDFDGAAKAAEQLSQQIEQMTPQQRQQLADQLEQMAQQLQQQAQQQTQRQQQAQQAARETLKQAGLTPEQIEEMTDSASQLDPQQLQQALDQQAQSSSQRDQAQQTAQKVQQQQQERQTAQENSQSASGLGESMQRMSQAARNQGDSQPGQGDQQPDQSASDSGEPSSFQQAAEQTARDLSRMAQRQQESQNTQQAQQQVQQMMQQIADSSQPGGREAGAGQAPMGPQQPTRAMDAYQVDPQQARSGQVSRDAPMMGTWVQDDQIQPGESTVGYEAAAREARQQAEQAVTQQRVPRQYHSPIRRYFDQLPQGE